MHINGVTVKAKLPSFKMGREGMLIDIQHSDLSKVGDAVDVLRQLPRINVSSTDVISVYGKSSFRSLFLMRKNMVLLVVCRSLPWVLHGTTSLS